MEMYEYTLWEVFPSNPIRPWIKVHGIICTNENYAYQEFRKKMVVDTEYIITIKMLR